MPIAVKDSFAVLTEALYADLGITIQPIDGYKSVYSIVRELTARIKYKDRGKIYQNFDALVSELNSLPNTSFEPPLGGDMVARRDVTGQELVNTIPGRLPGDPRLSGRIVQIGPKNIITPTLLYYLVHNAGQYGFVHYGPKDPTVWYWRGDIEPYSYNADEVVNTFSGELQYLL